MEAAAWAAYASGEEQAWQAWTETEAAAWSQYASAVQAAVEAWNAAAQAATGYNQAVQQATDAYNQAAEAAYEALAAACATAEAGWMEVVLPATQTYLAALASALAAWSEAAAQAAAARDDRLQAAQRTYAQRLQDLQSQADEAWQHYESALFDAGCVPPTSGPFQFVGYYFPRGSFDPRTGIALDEHGHPRPLTWGEWAWYVITSAANDPSNWFVLPLGMAKAPASAAAKAASAAAAKVASRLGGAAVSPVARLGKSITNWLGPGARVLRSDARGFVIQSRDGLRQFRIDFKGPGTPPAHAHFEVWDAARQRWVDAVPGQHRFPFSE